MLPPGTEPDNLELRNLGPAQFFEIEILTPESAAVTGILGAGEVDARFAPPSTQLRPRRV
ncbi:MAG: hypothetical protein VYD18_16960 [Candidatus Latescibacterota bacterium]|nr:hypothetical protein [Candidatus Latescibacterota bacterium]